MVLRLVLTLGAYPEVGLGRLFTPGATGGLPANLGDDWR